MSEGSLLLDIGLPFRFTSAFAHFILCSASLGIRHSIYADSNAAPCHETEGAPLRRSGSTSSGLT
jgi:hypothetical protein